MRRQFTPSARDLSDPAGLRRRLLYARWLYEKGISEAESPNELAHMVAIMHFHNAVEIVLQNILAFHEWATGDGMRNLRYDHMVNKVHQEAQKKTPPVALPLRTELIRLSQIRSSIIHQGMEYHRNEVEWARSVCRRFLVDAIRAFFNEDIQNLSMSDLVENAWVRTLLRDAEGKQEAGAHLQCVALCVLVVELAGTALARGLQRGRTTFRQCLSLDILRTKCDRDYRDMVLTLADHVADHVAKVENRLLLLHLGVDRDAAAAFFSWKIAAVGVSVLDGSPERKFEFSKHRDQQFGPTEGQLALHFATDVALKVEAIGLGEYMTGKITVAAPDGFGTWEPLEVEIPPERAPDGNGGSDAERQQGG